MREVRASHARSVLGTLLDAVERGDEVLVTRRGKPVAKLVRPDKANRASAEAAAARILARSLGVTLGGARIKDLIGNGRR